MAVFKAMKGKSPAATNPRSVATAIISSLPKTKLFKKTEIAGPGFINCFLDEVSGFLVQKLNSIQRTTGCIH
jgi:arginyl-tRNA synthetase